MQFNPLSVARVASLLAMALPFTLGRATHEPRAQLPSKDPFYQPPAGFEAKEPGAVLRSRRIIASFFSFIPSPIEAHQILYRTTAVNGSAIATVTTVFKPLFAKTDRFITYNTAYDSSSTNCNPSYSYQLGSDPASIVGTTNSVEFLVIQLFLLSGYVVSSPDYEGPDAAFTPGYLSGMGVLDSMRAVANFKRTLGLRDDPMVVGVGYSGGGLATGWAAAMQPAYAPELPVKGWVAGGIPANLTNIFEFIDGTVVSGFEPIAIAGMLKPSAHGAELQPLFDRIATSEGRKAIELANTACAVPNLVAFPFQSVLDIKFQSLGPDLLREPSLAPIITRNTLGINRTETPTAPVMMYHAQPDEIVPYGPAAVLREAWCGYGATVKFTNYAAGGHGTTLVLALADAVKFAGDAFAGRIASGCTSRTLLDDKLSPLALGLNLEPLAVGLINWIGAMGKQDAKWLEGIKQGKPI
ncbi:Lipase, secreted [Beauveria brongniartii RCEF 3172]|uniref:Lipase, secreted n=1 Tax=Beauveria brongniartii RCEF 3172 TaxID=1081107 RepID=A0A167GX50_9HYPO|nr:Lipase, secreted [Beauveria brongniartii RCEF 3172]